MHNVVDYTLASLQLQIFVKAMAVIFVDGPSLDSAPDNPCLLFPDRIVLLAVSGKHGTHCYAAAFAIVQKGNSTHPWVHGIVGRFHKYGTR
jgi:hypothetical protein